MDKLARELVNDSTVLARVKFDNYLTVSLGLRPCSQMNIPADLPGAEALGAAIDSRIYPLMRNLSSITTPADRLKAIESIKKEMRNAFKGIVEPSDAYRAHLKWAERLKLRHLSYEARPTVREIYLFREKGTGDKLRRLMGERDRLRRRTQRHPSPGLGRAKYAYPEEFDADWLRRLGELLGYPRCCVERYASERERDMSVEIRASQQIIEAERHGELNPMAYFIGYFFPCSPNCGEALSRGMENHHLLSEMDPSLGDLYKRVVHENMDLVRRQPEIISQYGERASRARRMLGQGVS